MVLWGRENGIHDPDELHGAYELELAARRRTVEERRSFLKASAATVAAVAVPGALLTGCDDEVTPPKEDEVIAIIGGGMAGVHCAFRLKEKGIKATIYEAQSRVGGRMFTARNKFGDGQLCELGGELIDTIHVTMKALEVELGLKLDDRFANEPMGLLRDVWFVNGVSVPDATLVTQFSAVAPVFQAAYNEEDEAKIAALDAMDLDTWLKANVPIATYPELHLVLQNAYRGEYGLENTQQSALNLIYFIDSEEPDPFRIFGDSDERFHTHTGNDGFPTLLSEKLDPTQIELSTKLLAARDAAGGGYEIDLEGPAGKVTKKVTRIVFALPFTVLREVDLSKLTLSAGKRKVINELGYGTNAKVMAGFKTRVWSAMHNSNGSMTTDMPVQQTWETSIGQAGETGILTNFLGGDQGLASGMGTEDDWVQGILPNLELVWPGITPAYSGTAVRMHWPTVPTMKGSYACYKPGQWAFFETEGVREGNLHFCGEHTSADFQGFMEGAAETGALVAAEILDDLGIAHSQGLTAALGHKTLIPQACYRAGRFGRLSRVARRRLAGKILREHYGL